MTNLAQLNDVERAVLSDLAAHSRPDEYFVSFLPIQRRTGLSRDFVRAACRSLTDRGLATYANGLWTEDGETAGAGYAATKHGVSTAETATPSDPSRIHAACCGPERESYVGKDGEPLGPDEPIPEPLVWEDERE